MTGPKRWTQPVGARPALVALALSASCGVEQNDTFCEDNGSCGEGRVCNAFTRQCRMDLGILRPELDVWGEFFCFEPTEGSSANGYLNMAFGNRAAASFGTTFSDQNTLVTRSRCQLRYVPDRDLYQVFSPLLDLSVDGGPQNLTFSVVLLGSVARAGGVQTVGPAGTFSVAVQDPDGTVRLGIENAAIELTERDVSGSPRFVRGFYEGRR